MPLLNSLLLLGFGRNKCIFTYLFSSLPRHATKLHCQVARQMARFVPCISDWLGYSCSWFYFTNPEDIDEWFNYLIQAYSVICLLQYPSLSFPWECRTWLSKPRGLGRLFYHRSGQIFGCLQRESLHFARMFTRCVSITQFSFLSQSHTLLLLCFFFVHDIDSVIIWNMRKCLIKCST